MSGDSDETQTILSGVYDGLSFASSRRRSDSGEADLNELDNETNGSVYGVEEAQLPQRPSTFSSLDEYGEIFNGLIEVLKCPNKTTRYLKEIPVTFQKISFLQFGPPVVQLTFTVSEACKGNLRDNNLTKGSVLTIHNSQFTGGHCQAVVSIVNAQTVSSYLEYFTAKEILEDSKFMHGLVCDIEFAPVDNQLVPYQRMQCSLAQFISREEDEWDEVTLSILGRTCNVDEATDVVRDFDDFKTLNNNQLEGVKYCLNRPLSLISAPPGTGKTRIAVALGHYFASERGCKVLMCASSNNAADKLAEALAEQGVEFVRIYSKTKERLNDVPDKIKQYALHNKLREQNSRIQSQAFEQILRLEDFTGIRLQREAYDDAGILEQADIVVATCNAAGDERLNQFSFPVVIVDEATQSLEPDCLIPITRGARQVILFGDAKQLGPVIEIQSAVKAGYNVSMFERLLPILGAYQLNLQYRMHPTIAKFSSKRFYEGGLRNGVSDAERTLIPKVSAIFPNGPLTWFDNPRSREKVDREKRSYLNKFESRQVAHILEHLFVNGIEPERIGVIAMYKSQMTEIRRTLNFFVSKHVAAWNGLAKSVKVGTVDGFQGQEKDIIIMSCVRANDNAAIGFLNNERRLNVAMTRARYGLAIVGSRLTLGHSDVWNEVIEYCRKNGSIQAGVPYLKPGTSRLSINLTNGNVSYR